MPAILLFTIQDAFQLSGRPGPVLVPGIPIKPDLPPVRIGTPIFIVTPSGARIDTQIAGVEMLNYGSKPPPDTPSTPIALPSTLSREQVPAGSKVYMASPASGANGA